VMTQTPTGPAADGTGQLDEAYQRLHATGPEFDGWLSNHGPMGAEAIVRHGHAAELGPWLDGYITRLEEFPRGLGPIGGGWRDALGDPRRIADWTGYFRAELAGQPWREVLGTWWPRLLPGVVAAATHGVIRTGHAVRALVADGEDEPHLTELAHGLAYWAARWQTLPAGHQGAAAAAAQGRARAQARDLTRAGGTDLSGRLAAVPRLPDQTGGIRDRLARLPAVDGWPDALAGLPAPGTPEETRATLTALVDAATLSYLRYGHGNPVMLVHAATAPNAVLRVLPVLDSALWAPSLAAAWAASSALIAIYAPAGAVPPAPPLSADPAPAGADSADQAASTFARAVEHGDAHVVKFADTALDVYGRTGNPGALAAAHQAADLISR
jgi:Questin oxidase-like